jgi:hypothetical protein
LKKKMRRRRRWLRNSNKKQQKATADRQRTENDTEQNRTERQTGLTCTALIPGRFVTNGAKNRP